MTSLSEIYQEYLEEKKVVVLTEKEKEHKRDLNLFWKGLSIYERGEWVSLFDCTLDANCG